jgi:hypothetical protein
MDEQTRKMLEDMLKNTDPKLVAKYGNPLDENDPRMWTPSQRKERGISLEDQVTYLGLDIEAQTLVLGQQMTTIATLRAMLMEFLTDYVTDLMKTNPEKAVKTLMRFSGVTPETAAPVGSWGPLDNNPDSPVRYAGSTAGIAPDQLIETPQGVIRADQIPGYHNDPSWKPSPDWVDANCMCPTHQASRKNNDGIDPFEPPNGMYL